jgi:hypothetical protein
MELESVWFLWCLHIDWITFSHLNKWGILMNRDPHKLITLMMIMQHIFKVLERQTNVLSKFSRIIEIERSSLLICSFPPCIILPISQGILIDGSLAALFSLRINQFIIGHFPNTTVTSLVKLTNISLIFFIFWVNIFEFTLYSIMQ